jgi:hypothetical protein
MKTHLRAECAEKPARETESRRWLRVASWRTAFSTSLFLLPAVITGCVALKDSNPPMARAGVGYVDFYMDSVSNIVGWNVLKVDMTSRTQQTGSFGFAFLIQTSFRLVP